MLGLLCFAGIVVLSNFEGGSAGRAEQLSAQRVRIEVVGQSDQDGRNRQANWYYFRLDQLPQTQVQVDLVNLAGEYNYRGPVYAVTKGTRPVYSYDGKKWKHFRDDQVFWDSEEPRLTVTFTPESDHIWIAHVPPYTNKDLAALLDSFNSNPFLRRESVGKTLEGREMPLLTITNPAVPEKGKKVIWLMFRQHAWETGSSWAGEGAIRFLLSNDQRAGRIRDRAVVRIFPMADPDGVAHGRVRFNGNGYDLNRNWDAIDPLKMPEIASQHKAVLDWLDSGRRIDLFLSLHNTESSEYLEAPAAYRALGMKIFDILKRTTTFNPTTPLREQGETTTPGKRGRMTVAQGLYHDRKTAAMLMEQMIEYNSKLGRLPTVEDRLEFGAALVRAIVAALEDSPQQYEIRTPGARTGAELRDRSAPAYTRAERTGLLYLRGDLL
ncbi:MAG TPA: M14-type cytosolic carboxypeptidase [Bryobacteraceae bacterium]|jgi:murein tripeptide amidase MpaA|nr:M14-type cytosolic carboxypeptidase [Bryobacteraceae bacterium]